MLNGIDISPVDQPNIQLNQVPCDFVIIQHSYGTYVHNRFFSQIGSAFALNKKTGVYHYVTGNSAEMDTFINGVRNYVGRSILALDFERVGNAEFGNFGYLSSFAERIINELHVRPLLYGSADIYEPLLNISRQLNCGLWIAQYADDAPTGYQSAPWNEQNYDMAIFQYSSTGSLSGYGGDLDLDLFYGDENTWDAYAKVDTPPQPAAPKIIDISIARAELNQYADTLPTDKKVIIYNPINEGLYLTSHNGAIEMTTDPMPWYVQKNGDNSISLADPWGNWITVPDNVPNGYIPSVVKGNGSENQRWCAIPTSGGFKLYSAIDATMCLDLPEGDDFNGQHVQVWKTWTTHNQVWGYKLYVEEQRPTPAVPKSHEIKHIQNTTEPTTADKEPVESDKKTVAEPTKVHEDTETENKLSELENDIKDLSNITTSQDNQLADATAGVIEEVLGSRKLSRNMVRAIMVLGTLVALTATVLLILGACGILPKYAMAIAGLISTFYAGFAHALGISATTK